MRKCLLFLFTSLCFTTLKAQLDDLIIVEYVDDNGGSGYAIKICNPTASSINLSNYYIQQFYDGASKTRTQAPPVQLMGNLASGDCMIAANTLDPNVTSNCTNVDFAFDRIGVNDNDAIALTYGLSNQWVDMINAVGFDGMPNFSASSYSLEKRKIVRNPDNCFRYTNTSGSGPNSWPTNSTTPVSGWQNMPASCLSPGNFTFTQPTKNRTLTICEGDSVQINGSWRKSNGTFQTTVSSPTACDTLLNINLNVLSKTITPINEMICAGETVSINSKSYTATGTFYDTLQAANGCDSILEINITSKPYLKKYDTVRICHNSTYNFQGIILTQEGDYTDTVKVLNDCDSIYLLHLTKRKKIETIIPVSICENESYYAAGMQQTVSGTYQDIYTATNGCDSVVITQLQIEPLKEKSESFKICEGITRTIRGVVVESDTTFVVEKTNALTCDSVITVEVSTIGINADFDYEQTEKLVQFNDWSSGADQFKWYFGKLDSSSFSNPFFQFPDFGEYSVQLNIENQMGCKDSMVKIIEVGKLPRESLFVPNAFTPNYDGVNDFFEVKYKSYFPFHIMIFNRWGEKLFESNELDFKWSGEFNGEELPQGSYYYRISGTYSKEGTVTLLR